MTLNLRERIILECITSIDVLTDSEKRLVDLNPELKALILENSRLVSDSSSYSEAPDKTRMLNTVRTRLNETKNKEFKTMSFISSLLTGRRWYWQVAAVMFIVLAFFGGAVMISADKSYAETNGVMLEVDLGSVPDCADGSCDNAVLHETLSKLQAEILAWVEANKSENPDAVSGETHKRKLLIAVNVNNGKAVARIGLIDEDSEKIESLKQALIAKGYPVLTVTDATWFECGDKEASMDGLTIDIGSHVFSFPMDSTEADIEKTINDWLAVNIPEMKAEVDVKIIEENGHKKVEVVLKLKANK
jgi:hypothetical protein